MMLLDIANGWKTAIMIVAMIAVFYLFLINAVNYHTIWVAFLGLYAFAQMLTTCVVSFDMYAGTPFPKRSNYILIFLASMMEPIIYHPLIVFFSLRGYWRHITGRRMIWGTMTRRGVNQEPAKKKKKS